METIAETIFLQDDLDKPAGLLSHGQTVAGNRHAAYPEAGPAHARRTGGGHVGRRTQKTAELLNRIAQGRSVIVIEHDMQFVEDIAHRSPCCIKAKVLSKGRWAGEKRSQSH